MGSKIKNVTFSLPVEVVEKLREYVRDNYIPSLNAGVKEALEEYTVKIERQIFKREMERAVKDPLFIADIGEAMSDFEKADTETAGRLEKW